MLCWRRWRRSRNAQPSGSDARRSGAWSPKRSRAYVPRSWPLVSQTLKAPIPTAYSLPCRTEGNLSQQGWQTCINSLDVRMQMLLFEAVSTSLTRFQLIVVAHDLNNFCVRICALCLQGNLDAEPSCYLYRRGHQRRGPGAALLASSRQGVLLGVDDLT